MVKKILITGSTDGIGLETAKQLARGGHHLLLHGRNAARLAAAAAQLPDTGRVDSYVADLSSFADVNRLAHEVASQHPRLDVLINNAGVYTAADPFTADGLDIRFVVNTLAPYLLTCRLLPALGVNGRVINLSSAAQSPVDLRALKGQLAVSDDAAYAQSKLAITMWTRHLAMTLQSQGPTILAVNPGSLLGSKMVRQAYGVSGGDLGVGAEILCRAALDAEFAAAGGRYFDNDSGEFASPHPDALNPGKTAAVMSAITTMVGRFQDQPRIQAQRISESAN